MKRFKKHPLQEEPAIPRATAAPEQAGDQETAPPGENQNPGPTTVGQDLRALLIKIAAILAAFALIFTFIFGVTRCTDDSMAPNIKEGDLVVYYRLDKRYAAEDVAVVKPNDQTQIRRVVAVAGDSVDINDSGLLVDGALQQEQGITGKTNRFEQGSQMPLTLADNQIFVCGDNRERVEDSRIYGPVSIKNTKGKVIGIIRRRNI